jgi:isocitrate dehydrogenase
MSDGDFYANEQSVVVSAAGKLRIELTDTSGKTTVLKDGVAVTEGDVIAASVMSRRALRVLREANRGRESQGRAAVAAPQGDDDEGVRSDHVRARSACVLQGRLRQARGDLRGLGVDPDNGIGDVYAKIQKLPADQRAAIEADCRRCIRSGRRSRWSIRARDHQPARAERRDHRRVDAGGDSALGQMWGPDGKLHDMKAMIPDRSYAVSIRRLSTIAESTAPSTCRRWEPCRMWG